MLREDNEYVEIYELDENGEKRKTDKITKRGQKLEEGYFVIGVNNWIVNSKGEILVQKRSRLKKNNPNKWSSTNGLREIKESSIDAIIRETKEELGVNISKDQITFVDSRIAGESLIVDIFFTIADINIADIKLQEEEVEEIRFVKPEELIGMDISTTCQYIKENINRYLSLINKK